jgi:hypothetical protein
LNLLFEQACPSRLGALDAKLEAQAITVAGFDQRIEGIDAAIGKLTEKGRATAALNAMTNQRKARERRCPRTGSGRWPRWLI